MKTKEEIKQKRDFFKALLNNDNESMEIFGVKQRAKIASKISLLNWVLDENTDNVPNLQYKILGGPNIQDKILSYLSMHPESISSPMLATKLGYESDSVMKAMTILHRKGRVTYQKIPGSRNLRAWRLKR